MTKRVTMKRVREIVAAVPMPGLDRLSVEAIGLLREAFAIEDGTAVPCPMCGYPVNAREAGTHLRHGYRTPHIEPPLPGSWNAERRDDDAELAR